MIRFFFTRIVGIVGPEPERLLPNNAWSKIIIRLMTVLEFLGIFWLTFQVDRYYPDEMLFGMGAKDFEASMWSLHHRAWYGRIGDWWSRQWLNPWSFQRRVARLARANEKRA